MAHTKSSKKRIRQNEKRRGRNKARLSRVRTAVRKLEKSIGAADPEELQALFRKASSELDRGAKRNLIHPNAAARKKSRLAKRLAGSLPGTEGAAAGGL